MNKKQISFQTKAKQSVFIIHHPHNFFDAEVHKYSIKGKSLLFADEMIDQMKSQMPDVFLSWLQSIQYHPLINPITAQLDPKKNVDAAISVLRNHDYVVPHEHLSEFLKHVDLENPPPKPLSPSMDFSIVQVTDKSLIDTFIGKICRSMIRQKNSGTPSVATTTNL